MKTVLDTVTLPNGELVAWGQTNAIDVAGLAVGEETVTLVHRAVYHFYGFEADTARGCINDGAAAPATTTTDGGDGEQAAAPAAGTGHTAPFTHAWRYFTKEIVGYADPVEVVYDFEDGEQRHDGVPVPLRPGGRVLLLQCSHGAGSGTRGLAASV